MPFLPIPLDVATVFLLLVVAIVLFAWERVSIDVAAIIIMGTLMVTGILTPEEGFSGFSNPATITIGALFILSEGLRRTGMLDAVGRYLSRLGRKNEWIALASIMLIVGAISPFMNNTAAVAILIPVVIGVAADLGMSASKMLIPLSFASMFGGVCTLIGTSANILVSSFAEENGFEPFSMFEFAPLGVIFFVIGCAYLFTVGYRILPERRRGEDLTADYEMREYLTDVIIEPGFQYIGQPLEDSPITQDLDLDVLSVFQEDRGTGEEAEQKTRTDGRPRRNGHKRTDQNEERTAGEHEGAAPRVQTADTQKVSATEPRAPDLGAEEQNRGTGAPLEAGDILRIRGNAREIEKLLKREDLSLRPTKEWYDIDLEHGPDTLLEAVVAPESGLAGKKIRDVNFRERFGAILLAVRHHGKLQQDNLGDLRLSGGDSVLLTIDRERIREVERDPAFVLASEIGVPKFRWHKISIALAILVGVIGTTAAGLLPIAVSATIGCILLILTGCLTTEEAYQAVNWKVIFLLAGVLPLGVAMEKTGAATILSEALLSGLSPLGPVAVVSGIYFLSMILTNVISNQATAVLMAPIALQTAEVMGLSVRPFLIAVTFGATLALLSPVAPVNTLVFGPGQYKFTDYARVGAPLSLLFWILATILIPFIWPF